TRRHAEKRKSAAGLEMDCDDGGVLAGVDTEERAVRARDDRAGESPIRGRVQCAVDAEFILVQVDDELERAAGDDALPCVRRHVAEAPEVGDERGKWRSGGAHEIEHLPLPITGRVPSRTAAAAPQALLEETALHAVPRGPERRLEMLPRNGPTTAAQLELAQRGGIEGIVGQPIAVRDGVQLLEPS